MPYRAHGRRNPVGYAHEIRQNIDVCIGMTLCGYDASALLRAGWTEEEVKNIKIARDSDTASLRDAFHNAPHSCYNREHDNGEKTGTAGTEE